MRKTNRPFDELVHNLLQSFRLVIFFIYCTCLNKVSSHLANESILSPLSFTFSLRFQKVLQIFSSPTSTTNFKIIDNSTCAHDCPPPSLSAVENSLSAYTTVRR